VLERSDSQLGYAGGAVLDPGMCTII